jgi:hypothetical protein
VRRRDRASEDIFGAGDLAGDPLVDADGGGEGARERLEGGLGAMVVVAAGELTYVDIQPALLGKRLEKVADVFRRQLAEEARSNLKSMPA